MQDIRNDKTKCVFCTDYEKVGTSSFDSVLLNGVITPSPGYPSFKLLNCQKLQPDHKMVFKVNFETFMVEIP